MRELEFLPKWYVRLRRQRRMALAQTWLTIALAAAMAFWLFTSDRRCRAKASELAWLDGQVARTGAELEQMDRLQALQRQMRRQTELYGRLGAHVESARLMARLSDAVPASVSLLSLDLEMEELPVPLSGAARAALKDPTQVPTERRLRVRIQGVAPTDLELSTLITELNKVPFFEQVAPSYVRDRREANHLMRQFEVSFMVKLSALARS